MLARAILIEVILGALFVFLIFEFLRGFKFEKRRLFVFIIPLLTYVIGFSLRLTTDKSLIDLGFFLTEFSTMFITILFTISLYLGQVKYWKIK